MISSPIGGRELRIASRSARFYKSRRNIAGIALVIFFCLYFTLGTLGWGGGRFVFNILSDIAFVYAVGVGVILTADCISSERRNGTLGLLFLTALKPYDVVAGNIVATSLKAFYGLLAALPVLGIGMLLGGVAYGEFTRVCLALISALGFSLTFSLLISCLNERHLAATSYSLLGLIFVAAVVPLVCQALQTVFLPYPTAYLCAQITELFSPTTALNSSTAVFGPRVGYYWISLAIVNLLSVIFFGLACVILRGAWKDRTAFSKKKIADIKPREKSRAMRAGILAFNPFYWLASRESKESVKFLLITLAFTIVVVVIGRFVFGRTAGGPFPAFVGMGAAWTWLTLGAHVAMAYKVAALSSQRLVEDRKSSALELLMSTPLTVGQILRGQWLALLRQLGGPALAVLLIHAIFLWSILTRFSLEDQIPGGAMGALRALISVLRSDQWPDLNRLGPAATIAGGGALIFLNWFALGWAGIWVGMRARRSALAVWTTLALVIVPPFTLFMAILLPAHWLGFSQDFYFWFAFCLIVGMGIGSLNAFILIAVLWIKLTRHFRAMAVDRFERPATPISISTVIRFAAVVAAPFVLIGLFYWEENWRGQRAWRRLEIDFARLGLKPDATTPVPPEVPAAGNLGAADVFRPLFAYSYDASGNVVWSNKRAREQLMNINLTGDSNPTNKAPSKGDWALQEKIDLPAWQQFYRTNTTLRATNEIPGRAILSALGAFDSDLNELQKLNQLPNARFPVHFKEGWAAFVMHRVFFLHIADILRLRAIAKLDLGENASAIDDIEFAVQLSRATRMEPGLHARAIQRNIALSTLQVIWEGLARHRWTESELLRIEKALQMDFLAEYPRGIREEFRMIADFWSDPSLWRSTPPLRGTARVYPTGWKLLNQSGILRLAEENFIPVVDTNAHRVYRAKAAALTNAIIHSGVRADPAFSFLIGPGGASHLADVPMNFAYSQVCLNEALAACALERWRLAHGSYPQSLGEVGSIPSDPITGEPFKYRMLPNDRFLLYSIGWNETDDGGKVATTLNGVPKVPELNLKEGDWVWTFP